VVITLLRWLLMAIGGILLLLSLAVLFLWWSNRDLPVEVLEQRYGGDNLQTVDVQGVPLRYKVEGQGPPLLLLHSHFYTMRMWQPWVDELAGDFTLIRYDLTSHGLTGPDPTDDYSRQRGIELALGLLDHLGLNKVSVAGSSTGGALAWYLAANAPERVDKLILINAPGMPRVTNKYMERELPDWGGYVLYLLPAALFKPFLQAPVVRREGNRLAEFQRLLGWEKGDVTPTLAKISAPTLIMWGENNPQLPVEHVGQYQQALTNAERVETRVYPGIGHVVPLEIPRQSARDVRAFLRADSND
jgi:pimeloyl-ACP methyl ester carboxylesterase